MILTVTFNPAIDHTYVIDEDLESEKIMRTSESHFDAGGKGINVASYLNTLGHDSLATGLLGGFTGDYIRTELDREGLAHDFAEGGITRINTTVAGDNEEYKLNHSGPETGEKAVERVLSKVSSRSPGKVVISGSLPPGLDSSAVEEIASEVETDVAVDLHGDVLGELEEKYFLAKPNRNELSEATGIDIDSIQKCREAAEKLLDRGFENVLASMGEDGALLVTEERALYAEGLDSDVADTTGAGDAMLSAMLAGLEENKDKKEAFRKALAFATLVVETPGTGKPEIEKMNDYVERVEVEEL
ncbi:hexose kinase [Candidatus Nanohaloarchaea archaeon]|nr:hexose kinase [Candidatus Nanohaloarchaea archaeon]